MVSDPTVRNLASLSPAEAALTEGHLMGNPSLLERDPGATPERINISAHFREAQIHGHAFSEICLWPIT